MTIIIIIIIIIINVIYMAQIRRMQQMQQTILAVRRRAQNGKFGICGKVMAKFRIQ